MISPMMEVNTGKRDERRVRKKLLTLGESRETFRRK